jgi:hypothetical protein
MLIGVTDAIPKIAASATTTAAPPVASGSAAATSDPNTSRRGQRQRDQLALAEVGLRHLLDVAVERRPTGQLDVEAVGVDEAIRDPGQRGGRVVRRDREEDDVVGRVPVGRDLAGRERVRDDSGDVRRGRERVRRRRGRRIEFRRSGAKRVAVEDDDDR